GIAFVPCIVELAERAVVEEDVDKALASVDGAGDFKHRAVVERLVQGVDCGLFVKGWVMQGTADPVLHSSMLSPDLAEAPDRHSLAGYRFRLVTPGVILKSDVAHL